MGSALETRQAADRPVGVREAGLGEVLAEAGRVRSRHLAGGSAWLLLAFAGQTWLTRARRVGTRSAVVPSTADLASALGSGCGAAECGPGVTTSPTTIAPSLSPASSSPSDS